MLLAPQAIPFPAEIGDRARPTDVSGYDCIQFFHTLGHEPRKAIIKLALQSTNIE
jgi:hypothetical protein